MENLVLFIQKIKAVAAYIISFCLLLAIFIPKLSAAIPVGNGVVTFYMSHTDKLVTIHYRDAKGQWVTGVDEQIAKLMSSRVDNQTHTMDRRLIELADHLQDHFKASAIEVICGYRSPAYNAQLKNTGHNVAGESYHMQGLAMDIHIDEISETALRDYLLSLGLGGVGYYGDKLMIHMDFGPVRTWQDGNYRENTTIGIFDAEEPLIQLRTQKLFYREGDVITLTGQNLEKMTDAYLEKFSLGRWQRVKNLNKSQIPLQQPTELRVNELWMDSEYGFFGKYRIHLGFPAGGWQNSNEFYVKKM